MKLCKHKHCAKNIWIVSGATEANQSATDQHEQEHKYDRLMQGFENKSFITITHPQTRSSVYVRLVSY